MRTLVFLVAVGVVVGDVSHLGYHYNVPKTSYGVPSYQANANQAQGNQGSQGLSAGLANGYQSSYSGQIAGYQGQQNAAHQGLTSGHQQAGYQGHQATGYQGQQSTGYQGQQTAGYQGLTSGQQNTGYQTQQSTGYQGQQAAKYQGQQSTGYQGQQNYQQTGHHGTAYQGQKSGNYQGVGAASQQSSGYQTPSYNNQAGQANNAFQTSVGSSSVSVAGSQPAVLSSADVPQGNFQYQSNYQASGEQKYQQYYQYQQQPAQVFKHFYVHAAPAEPEVAQFRKPVVLPAPQKHYKIIFIKTPTAPAYTAPVVPVQQQNEEKTIVYVLVNKPEAPQEAELPKVEQKPPSKPEVYFIKYNSKENSQAVINNIVNDFNKGEGQTTFSGSDVNYADGSKTFGAQQSVGFSNDEAVNHVSVQSQSLASVESQTVSSPVESGNNQNYVTAGNVNSAFDQRSGSESSGLVQGTVSSGLTHGTVSGSSSNYDSSISTSQGVPHETYGVPSFRSS